jgi:predicted acylesterase/phospholipase RssA
MTELKRAITLGGGGPAAGLHIGVLERLNEAGIRFDVWALSCIGAWVGIVYNQCKPGKEVEQTYDFFRDGVFRDDVSYERFPINAAFGPDWRTNTQALVQFVSDPTNYQNLWLPREIAESLRQTFLFLTDRSKWTEGDFNQWVFNNVLAVNPFIRYLASLMYLSNVNGLSRIYYPDSTFMKRIDFEKLYQSGKPHIFHNAWNLTKQKLQLFSNKRIGDRRYKNISAASLCACSALPFVEETVQLDGDTYCEGALVDTVNFKNLLEDHFNLSEDRFELDEIWISRIVDATQVHRPRDLHDSLGNLCELFAATVGEDDVKLFKYHVKEGVTVNGELKKWAGTIVEIHVDPHVNFKWTHSNLDHGRERGYRAADEAYTQYKDKTGGKKNATGEVRIINERKEDHRERTTVEAISPSVISRMTTAAGRARPSPLQGPGSRSLP